MTDHHVREALYRAPFEDFDLLLHHDAGLSASTWDDLFDVLGMRAQRCGNVVQIETSYGAPKRADVLLRNVALGPLNFHVMLDGATSRLPVYPSRCSGIEFRAVE